VGRLDPAKDGNLGLREGCRDGVAEEADRPSGVLRGEAVEVLGRARLGHLDDHSADLEVPQGPAWVVAQECDAGVAAHVPLLGEAAHRVDPQALTVEVAPHDRRLRVPIRCDRGERGYRRALGQIAVGRRDLVWRGCGQLVWPARRRYFVHGSSLCGGPSPVKWRKSRSRTGGHFVINPAQPGSWGPVARARSVAGYAIPGIALFFIWMVIVILAIILLAFIVHWAGGGVLNLRLGHFILNVGFT
jgi:hypothetical protein